MIPTDMRGIYAAIGAPVNRPDMVGLPNPLSGYPAAGYPKKLDPNFAAADPSSIANLQGWWKASDFDNVAHGTEVAQWYDHSGLARGGVAIASAGSRMTVSRNALNGNMTAIGGTNLRGFQTQMNVANMPITSSANYTIFVVLSYSSLAASESNFFGLKNNNLVIRYGINSTGPGDLNLVYPNVGNFRTTTALTVTTWHYIIFETVADVETFYLDGTALTWASTPSAPSGNSPQELFLLDDNGTGNFRGLCAELGIYDRAISSGERTTLFTYFQTRYGLP